jgi:hypothetical protein
LLAAFLVGGWASDLAGVEMLDDPLENLRMELETVDAENKDTSDQLQRVSDALGDSKESAKHKGKEPNVLEKLQLGLKNAERFQTQQETAMRAAMHRITKRLQRKHQVAAIHDNAADKVFIDSMHTNLNNALAEADLEVAKKQLAEESNIENHVKRHTKSGEPISKMGDSQVDENEAKETSPKVQKTSSKSKQPTTPPPKAKHHTKEKDTSISCKTADDSDDSECDPTVCLCKQGHKETKSKGHQGTKSKETMSSEKSKGETKSAEDDAKPEQHPATGSKRMNAMASRQVNRVLGAKEGKTKLGSMIPNNDAKGNQKAAPDTRVSTEIEGQKAELEKARTALQQLKQMLHKTSEAKAAQMRSKAAVSKGSGSKFLANIKSLGIKNAAKNLLTRKAQVINEVKTPSTVKKTTVQKKSALKATKDKIIGMKTVLRKKDNIKSATAKRSIGTRHNKEVSHTVVAPQIVKQEPENQKSKQAAQPAPVTKPNALGEEAATHEADFLKLQIAHVQKQMKRQGPLPPLHLSLKLQQLRQKLDDFQKQYTFTTEVGEPQTDIKTKLAARSLVSSELASVTQLGVV